MRISPATYRQIEDRVTGERIEIGGESVPITTEKAHQSRGSLDRDLSEAVS